MNSSGYVSGQNHNSATRPGTKIYSIAAVQHGRDFKGRFTAAGSTYAFVYSPSSGEISGRRLRLAGTLTVTDSQGRDRSQDRVHVDLAATQGGSGGAPPRRQIPGGGPQAPEAKPAGTRSLPKTDNTGPTAFVGVMYMHFEPLDGSRFGVPADLSRVQLNARLWATDDLARNLHDVYSQLVEAVYGEPARLDDARVLLAELNRMLK